MDYISNNKEVIMKIPGPQIDWVNAATIFLQYNSPIPFYTELLPSLLRFLIFLLLIPPLIVSSTPLPCEIPHYHPIALDPTPLPRLTFVEWKKRKLEILKGLLNYFFLYFYIILRDFLYHLIFLSIIRIIKY